MRKTVLTFCFAVVAFGVMGQRWADVGVKGEFGLNGIFNKNIQNDNQMSSKISTGFGVGGKVGFNLNENHEITLDVIWTQFRHEYLFNMEPDSVTGASPQFNKSLRYNAIEILPLYRHNKNGSYLEVGPVFSFLGKNTSGSNNYLLSSDPADIQPLLNTTQIGAVFGFGQFMAGTDNFGITLGARFKYMFTDLISEQGKALGYPSERTYDSYTPSHAFSAMLVMEFNYDLGYLAHAKCGKRTKLIFF